MMEVTGVARALFSRKWWWVTLFVVALMILLARLGFWQLDRLAQRRAANAQLLAAIESAPINLNEDYPSYITQTPGGVSTNLLNQDVVASGTFDYENQRILKLQSWDGRAGVHLITPLILDSTAGVAVLVNRGWIPDAEYAAGNLYNNLSGAQPIEGYITLTETISRRTADAVVPVSPGSELFRVDIAALAPELPYTLLPFYIKLAPQVGSVDQLPIPVPKEVDLSEGPHLDYALQWFVFSAGLGIAYLIYVTRWLKMRDTELHPNIQR